MYVCIFCNIRILYFFRKVQTAGVAPTDDSFTIIIPSESYNIRSKNESGVSDSYKLSGDRDQNGPALVGDPDLGFEGLAQFGPVSERPFYLHKL